MKIKSLFLGSVAAAGLSTGAFAADLGVLTSLDVCDALGLSGLTISSDTNCLQITGEVKYEFNWGDYEGDGVDNLVVETGDGLATVVDAVDDDGDHLNDWNSRVDAWIKFVATADSDFGPAKAVIKIKEIQQDRWLNGTYSDGSDTGGVIFDEAYVSVGDSTILMAGKKGTIMKFGEDEPLNFLGLFNSDEVDKGVKWSDEAGEYLGDGGHVIQIVSDLGNGVSVGAGLENLNNQDDGLAVDRDEAGTAVGVVSYAGDGIAAHVTVAAGGILDGTVEEWGVHAGFAATFDVVKVVAAIAGDSTGYWNGLASASASFDMFTIAISGEAVQNTVDSGDGTDTLDHGFGASIGAAVTDGISINLGGRWYHDESEDNDGWQAAVQLVAAVTETVTLTGEVGAFGNDLDNDANTVYGAATVGWAPGGGFTSSLKGEVYGNGGYKTTFKAAKTFE
ncbi:MAG TPA: hypothetical protein VGN80_01485 [Devosiaceae bacterium]|jgi:hypothetical protein|nr:hypothetical protein [Devosiaceae bacterium]